MLFKNMKKVGGKTEEGAPIAGPAIPGVPENCLSAFVVSSGSSLSPLSQVPNLLP